MRISLWRSRLNYPSGIQKFGLTQWAPDQLQAGDRKMLVAHRNRDCQCRIPRKIDRYRVLYIQYSDF